MPKAVRDERIELIYLERLEKADTAIGEVLMHAPRIRVEDFHDLTYIRERIQIMRKAAEK